MIMGNCPLVRIEWMDSSQPIASWKFLSYYRDNPGRPCKCVSVGWMIRDDEDLKVLVANFGGVENEVDPERTPQACGVIQIPTCCVVRISALNERGDKQLFPRSFNED